MSLKFVFGILILINLVICDDDFLIINLADGGTSSPIKLMPVESEDTYESTMFETDVKHINESNITINLHKSELETKSSLPEIETIHPDLQNLTYIVNLTSIIPIISPSTVSETTTILPDHEITTAAITKTISPTTQTEEQTTLTTMSDIPTTAVVQSTIPDSGDPSVITPTANETKLCHETCRNDVGGIHLYPLQIKLTLPVGSNLTLVCELPLTGNFKLENILWLYEAERTPECSLTSQEFIQSCTGFQVIHNEDDRNETFLRETLDLTGLSFNNTGTFICQAEVTCCQDTNDQNVIIKQQYLNVKIWHSDYTLDFAIMGSVAAVMTLAVAIISFFISRRRRNAYVAIDNEIIEDKPSTVLHMPLVQYDDDDDSFDSNFDE